MQETEDGGFAKIYGDRLEGSSLMECRVATRWCFVFMSSTANKSGFFRCANASVLARRANVTLEEAELAIQELEAPDPDSTTPDNDGRRIVRTQGGWQIVTHQYYRNLRSSKQIGDADRQQNKRERDKEDKNPSRPVTPRHGPSQEVALDLEAEAEIEAEEENKKQELRSDSDSTKSPRREAAEVARQYIAVLDAVTGRKTRKLAPDVVKAVEARLKDKWEPWQIAAVPILAWAHGRHEKYSPDVFLRNGEHPRTRNGNSYGGYYWLARTYERVDGTRLDARLESIAKQAGLLERLEELGVLTERTT